MSFRTMGSESSTVGVGPLVLTVTGYDRVILGSVFLLSAMTMAGGMCYDSRHEAFAIRLCYSHSS
jgi:hypothetical protein